MEQPFIFGVPAGEDHFIGREKELSRISSNFKYGINTILMSPRRWGKTSLVNRAAEKSKGEDYMIIQMDIFACRTEYDFYNTFSSELLRQSSSVIDEWKYLAQGFIERLTPRISISPDLISGCTISLGITPKTHSPEEVLSLPQKIAERKGKRIVVCIDEFQQIGEFPDALEVQKRLRGAWQNQDKVSYCLFGSKMHMMSNLFLKKSYPFYRFGEILNLEPIPLEKWVPFIQERFAACNKSISLEAVSRICSTVEYQASYVQQLAYAVLLMTDNEVTEDILEAAEKDLVAQNSSVFIEQTQSLTGYQINFLRAILEGVSSGFGESKIRETYNLGSASNIARLKSALIDKELIELTEKGVIIGDPVLRMWLRGIL
jgi:hypothetical protein